MLNQFHFTFALAPLLTLVLTCSGTQASEGIVAPSTTPLSRVIRNIENRGIKPVSASADGRQWVIDGIEKKKSVRIWVNASNGGIMKREEIDELEPIESPLKMSKVVRKMEEANPGPIYRVHFAKDRWIIETRRGKTTTIVELSSKTGELLLGKDAP